MIHPPTTFRALNRRTSRREPQRGAGRRATARERGRGPRPGSRTGARRSRRNNCDPMAADHFEARSPYLGFDVPEAIILTNSAYSIYTGPVSLTIVLGGLQFIPPTLLEVLDTVRPTGSTAGVVRPTSRRGFTAPGNASTPTRTAPSEFDRRTASAELARPSSFGSKSGSDGGSFRLRQGSVGAATDLLRRVTAATAARTTTCGSAPAASTASPLGAPRCAARSTVCGRRPDPPNRPFNPSVCAPREPRGEPEHRGFATLAATCCACLLRARDLGWRRRRSSPTASPRTALGLSRLQQRHFATRTASSHGHYRFRQNHRHDLRPRA